MNFNQVVKYAGTSLSTLFNLLLCPCKGAGNLQFSFVKKRSDRYNFPTIYATVLDI